MLLLGAIACTESPTSPDDPAGPDASPQALITTCTPAIFAGFVPKWTCATTVDFYSSSSTLRDKAGAAAADWQAKTSGTFLPYMNITNLQSLSEATIAGESQGSVFCGVWNPDTETLTIQKPPTHCSGAVTGTLENIFRHELGHALGWTGSIIDNQGVAGASAHCVMNLNTGLNTGICRHEIEGALAAYGLRSVPSASTFWQKPFVVGSVNTLAADTVEAGATVQMASPGNWERELGSPVAGSYVWSSSNTGIATVSQGGLVTGVAQGTVTIRATPASSSTYLFTKAFEEDGVSALVTVLLAELPMVTVTSITHTGDTLAPFYTTGSYTFSATLGTGDTTGVKYRWIFKDSRTPNDSVVYGDTSAPYTFGMRTASYTISSLTPSWTLWVKAIPMRDSTLGSYAVREWPVCVQPSGGEALRTDEESNAVGGC